MLFFSSVLLGEGERQDKAAVDVREKLTARWLRVLVLVFWTGEWVVVGNVFVRGQL